MNPQNLPPSISILLPTRRRPEPLRTSVQSLRDLAHRDDIEVLLGVDSDDSETLESLNTKPLEQSRVFVTERYGYIGLHRYVNNLAHHARGRWLFLWNDDAIMTTPGWDDVVRAYDGKFLLLNPNSNHNNHFEEHCIFPIVPAQWVKALGHFSLSNHNDSWVEHVAKQLGIIANVDIYIQHERVDLTGANDDETARERVYTSSEFAGKAVQDAIGADADYLRQMITPTMEPAPLNQQGEEA